MRVGCNSKAREIEAKERGTRGEVCELGVRVGCPSDVREKDARVGWRSRVREWGEVDE